MKIERFELIIDNAYDPVAFDFELLNERLEIHQPQAIGFVISSRWAPGYLKRLERAGIGYSALFYPTGFGRKEGNPQHLISFNALDLRGDPIVVRDIETIDTLVWASIGMYRSPINNGCWIKVDGSPRLYWTEEGFQFTGGDAKKMLDYVLMEGGIE